jgi:hypothetical protein
MLCIDLIAAPADFTSTTTRRDDYRGVRRWCDIGVREWVERLVGIRWQPRHIQVVFCHRLLLINVIVNDTNTDTVIDPIIGFNIMCYQRFMRAYSAIASPNWSS